MSFAISRISDAMTAYSCLGLTFPLYRPLLHAHTTPGVFAVAATQGAVPIGLGLAQLIPGQTHATLLSVAVEETRRCGGVATALVQALAQELRAAGAEVLLGAYLAAQPTTAAVERLLLRCGFDPPRPRNLLCAAGFQILRAPVLGAASLPAEATITPWLAVDASERAHLREELAAHREIPANVDPFLYEYELLPACCFALRQDRRVIGWVLSQNAAADTVRVVSIYVLPQYQGGAYYPCLQARLIETMLKHGRTRATWTVAMQHQELVRYHRLYLLPYLDRCDESREAELRWSVPR